MRDMALRAHLGRGAMIGLMLAGGILAAGVSQAQEVGDQDIRAERQAELIAASGGPASPAHLTVFAADKADVDVRDDDVAPIAAPTAMPVTPVSLTGAPTQPATDAPARQVASAGPAQSSLK